jgi:hypothetical protein
MELDVSPLEARHDRVQILEVIGAAAKPPPQSFRFQITCHSEYNEESFQTALKSYFVRTQGEKT